MQYRTDKYGNQISALGFGCMRFPQTLGKIDMAATEKLLLHAIESGVNYFDTAYIYPGSEAAVGDILHKHGLRDKVYIATKLPHYLIRSVEGAEKTFQEELRRLKTDHIDYYLMHMLTDVGAWEKLKTLGVVDWLEEQKRRGTIRQIGFSYHGNAETFCRLVDVYDWDFCQIQYNYMDEHSQAGRRGLHYAHEKGLPVVIMEPLRGGRLVNHLPEEAEKIFASHTPGYTPAQWGLRWLWDQPEVTCILSGMNAMAQVQDNIDTACDAAVGALTEADQAMLRQVVAAINARMKVGCTGCGYCMPCPKNVDIPGTFAAYNRRYSDGKFRGLAEYAMCTALRRQPTSASNCIGCGKCEQHCPQGLPIREKLKEAASELEGPVYRTARKLNQIFKLF
ncbi:MAG: aldo/keto reductase [Oscillospiraceae bacterium]|nr:aldo/keto reductase [Oscillospiraceae bacterium]